MKLQPDCNSVRPPVLTASHFWSFCNRTEPFVSFGYFPLGPPPFESWRLCPCFFFHAVHGSHSLLLPGGHTVSITYGRSHRSDQDGGQTEGRVDEACDKAGDLGGGEGRGGQGPLVETLAGQTSQSLKKTAAHFQKVGQNTSKCEKQTRILLIVSI